MTAPRRPQPDRPSDLAATRRLTWFDWWLETPNDDEHGNLDTFAVAAIAVLFKHMNRDGWCKPGIRTIAAQMGCSKQPAEDRLDLLEELGAVYRYRRNNAVTFYAAAFPEHHPLYVDCPTTQDSCPWHRRAPRGSRGRATVLARDVNCPTSGSKLSYDVGPNPGTRVTGARPSVAGAPFGAPLRHRDLDRVKVEVDALAAQVTMGPPPTDLERLDAHRRLVDAVAEHGVDAVVEGCRKARGYEYQTLNHALTNAISAAIGWRSAEEADEADD